ncbi:hypothetical protein Pyrfu_1167 [Pyrolobus fumarii 1A]|uniref:PIN domain-containing protein n=1 Tax=Pyrolobus fumarii (strain DSM 11204 / 1A) TaxID=694429 RepID=G0EFK6_PYRF1|nr:PIN domain-containing protein [Pyrolobus fumarii]AEM39030.1 hypothetical protein Pyrfu_1167 [Pyrolobus fumarii 1A]
MWSCKLLLDTNIIIALIGRDKGVRQSLASFIHFMVKRKGCSVCYHEVSLREIRVVRGPSVEARATTVLAELGVSRCGPPESSLRSMAGRYARSVKRLGLNDVLIALAARENTAILVTGDYSLASFYASIARPVCRIGQRGHEKSVAVKPFIYIPLPALTGECEWS